MKNIKKLLKYSQIVTLKEMYGYTSFEQLTDNDKELLLKLWKCSQTKTDGQQITFILKDNDNIDYSELNLLKAKGLVVGVGSELYLTSKGTKTLKDAILESKSALRKFACKYNKSNNINLSKFSTLKLKNMLKQVVAAENDALNFEILKNNNWKKKYDFEKLIMIKQAIKNALKKNKKKLIPITIAKDDYTRAIGLMYRDNIKNNECALFIFDKKCKPYFWNKNVKFPIDVAFFDEKGELVTVKHLMANQTDLITCDSDNIKYVVETNYGWFRKNKIKKCHISEILNNEDIND